MATLMRWDPAAEVDSLQSEVNRIFDGFFGGSRGNGARRWLPPMDLKETGDHLVLSLDLPGMDRDDVTIEVKDDVLTVSGKRERRTESGDADGDYHRVERSYGSFARSLALPKGIDREGITADFDRGVLDVRIPKPEQRTPHRVEIRGGSPKTIDAGDAADES